MVLLSVKAGVPDTGFVLTASAVQADANAGANATVPVSTQRAARPDDSGGQGLGSIKQRDRVLALLDSLQGFPGADA